AESGWGVVGDAEVHLDGRRLPHAQQAEGVEIPLHHPAALDGDRLVKRGAESVEYCALCLIVGARGVDDLPADIACCPDLVDLGGTIRRNACLDDFGKVTVMAVVEGEPHAGTAWQLLTVAPRGLLGDQLQHPPRPPGIKRRLRTTPARRHRHYARRTVEVET